MSAGYQNSWTPWAGMQQVGPNSPQPPMTCRAWWTVSCSSCWPRTCCTSPSRRSAPATPNGLPSIGNTLLSCRSCVVIRSCFPNGFLPAGHILLSSLLASCHNGCLVSSMGLQNTRLSCTCSTPCDHRYPSSASLMPCEHSEHC